METHSLLTCKSLAVSSFGSSSMTKLPSNSTTLYGGSPRFLSWAKIFTPPLQHSRDPELVRPSKCCPLTFLYSGNVIMHLQSLRLSIQPRRSICATCTRTCLCLNLSSTNQGQSQSLIGKSACKLKALMASIVQHVLLSGWLEGLAFPVCPANAWSWLCRRRALLGRNAPFSAHIVLL